jgi:hypothetical protein
MARLLGSEALRNLQSARNERASCRPICDGNTSDSARMQLQPVSSSCIHAWHDQPNPQCSGDAP